MRVTQAAVSLLLDTEKHAAPAPIRVTQAAVSLLLRDAPPPDFALVRVTQAAVSLLLEGPVPTLGDIIAATEPVQGIVQISVQVPGNGLVSRVLQRSATVDFASFVIIPQSGSLGPTTDPAETLEMVDAGTVPETTYYYRTLLEGANGSEYSNIASITTAAVAHEQAEAPGLTIELIGETSVTVSLTPPVLPVGHSIVGMDFEIFDASNNLVIPLLSIAIPDPDTLEEYWLDIDIQDIGPKGEQRKIRARYVSEIGDDTVLGIWSDLEPFTLDDLEEPPLPENPDEAVAGPITFVVNDEWPYPHVYAQWSFDVAPNDWDMYQWQFQRLDGTILSKHGPHWDRNRFNQGVAWLLPGQSYQIIYWGRGGLLGPLSEPRRTAFTVPLVNLPPWFTVDGGQHLSGPSVPLVLVEWAYGNVGVDTMIVPGTWPVDISFDNGATWLPLLEDGRTTYSASFEGLPSGMARMRTRNVPLYEGEPSRWRYSVPVYVNMGAGYERLAGATLELSRFTQIGSGDWQEVGSPDTRRIRYIGGDPTGGALSLNDIGFPQSFEITVVGSYATGVGPNWIAGFFSEMESQWGGGAFQQDSPYFQLVGRAGGEFGAWGHWVPWLLTEGSRPDWYLGGARYGRGSQRYRLDKYTPDTTPEQEGDISTFGGLGPSGRRQWVKGAMVGVALPRDPLYTLWQRFTVLSVDEDGHQTVKVESQLAGPDVDSELVTEVDLLITDVEWPCGFCGFGVRSGSNNIIEFQSLSLVIYALCGVVSAFDPPELRNIPCPPSEVQISWSLPPQGAVNSYSIWRQRVTYEDNEPLIPIELNTTARSALWMTQPGDSGMWRFIITAFLTAGGISSSISEPFTVLSLSEEDCYGEDDCEDCPPRTRLVIFSSLWDTNCEEPDAPS